MATWNVELWQPLGGCITNLPMAKSLQITQSTTEGATVSFTMNGLDPKAALIQEMFTDIVVYRDSKKLFRGRCLQATPNGDATGCTVTVSAVDYKSLLKRRFVRDAGKNTGELESIAWALINAVQTRDAGGDLGITRGVNQDTGVSVTGFQREAGSAIADLIDTLAHQNSVMNANDAFEWDIDPDLVFKVYRPTRGKRTPTFVADFGGSVLSYDQQFDPSGYANVFYVQGAGAYQATVYTDDSRRPIPGGLFEEYVSEGDLTTAALVDARAFWLATFNGQIELTKTYNLELSNAKWLGPESCWAGDFVHLDIQHGPLNVQTDQMRVKDIHISVEDSGYEHIAIGVGYSVASSYRDFNRMNSFMLSTRRDILKARALWYKHREHLAWVEYRKDIKKEAATVAGFRAKAALEKKKAAEARKAGNQKAAMAHELSAKNAAAAGNIASKNHYLSTADLNQFRDLVKRQKSEEPGASSSF